jgi:glycosyltransferase involved in cell wall biosynthesis
VDDGSTDRSIDIIYEFICVDQRFTLVCQDHSGISNAIKNGIEKAKSAYIVLMDQDDIALPQRLQKIAEAFAAGAELIMSDYEIVNELSLSVGRTVTIPNYITAENILLEEWKRNYFLGSAMAFIWKKDFEMHPLSGGCTDYDISLKMLLRGYRFCYIPEVLLKYRVHRSNTSADYRRMKNDAKLVLGQYDESELLNHLLIQGYRRSDVLLAVGVFCLFLERLQSANSLFNQVFSCGEPMKDRLRMELLFYSAVCNYKQGEMIQSLKLLHQMVDEGLLNPAVANNLGVLYTLREQLEAACFWFNKAIAMNRGYQDAAKNMELIRSGEPGKINQVRFTERLLRDTLTHVDNLKNN